MVLFIILCVVVIAPKGTIESESGEKAREREREGEKETSSSARAERVFKIDLFLSFFLTLPWKTAGREKRMVWKRAEREREKGK